MKEIEVRPNSLTSKVRHSGEEPAPHHIESDTVDLKRITDFSSQEIFDLFNTARKDSFDLCGWEHTESIEDAEDFLKKRMDAWIDENKFSYGVIYEGELAGVTYAKEINDEPEFVVEFGLWLHNDYWGENISGLRADVLLHIVFEALGVDRVTVGTLEPNQQSRSAIEKYVSRYNGVFYGAPLVPSSYYSDMEENLLPHYEYSITKQQFESGETGISTTLPNTEYSELDFSENEW